MTREIQCFKLLERTPSKRRIQIVSQKRRNRRKWRCYNQKFTRYSSRFPPLALTSIFISVLVKQFISKTIYKILRHNLHIWFQDRFYFCGGLRQWDKCWRALLIVRFESDRFLAPPQEFCVVYTMKLGRWPKQ